MDKVIRNGKVAVLFSPGFGAGWYTWNTEHKAMLYDPTVVKWVEDGGDAEAVLRTLDEKYPGCYLGGLRDLDIRWVPVGTRFYIHEYDGSESVVLVDTELDIQVA